MSATIKADLIKRLQDGRRGNALDVEIEVAVFKPDDTFASVRANAAGTKVIYTRRDGTEQTFWARDWTMNAADAIHELGADQ